jgi:hypothetical protein
MATKRSKRNSDSRPGQANWAQREGYYRIEFCLEVQALGADEQDSIININGRIIHSPHEDETLDVGRVRGHLIQVSRMIERGEDILEECDAHSQTLADYAFALFDPQTYELRTDINKVVGDVFLSDVLVLDIVEVHSGHRGFGLGAAAATRFIEIFGRTYGIAVCKPFPLQLDVSRKDDQKWLSQMQMEQFTQESKSAKKKLQNYWGRLGFKRLPGTPYYGLNLEYRNPSRADLGLE